MKKYLLAFSILQLATLSVYATDLDTCTNRCIEINARCYDNATTTADGQECSRKSEACHKRCRQKYGSLDNTGNDLKSLIAQRYVPLFLLTSD